MRSARPRPSAFDRSTPTASRYVVDLVSFLVSRHRHLALIRLLPSSLLLSLSCDLRRVRQRSQPHRLSPTSPTPSTPFNPSPTKANSKKQVICEKVEKSDIATIDKKKYLVPADLTVGQFVYVIRKRIKLSPEKAIFIFVDEVLPPTAALMSSIYEEHKDEDG